MSWSDLRKRDYPTLLGATSRRVLDMLAQRPHRYKEIAAAVGHNNARDVLNALIRRGLAERASRGVYQATDAGRSGG